VHIQAEAKASAMECPAGGTFAGEGCFVASFLVSFERS